MNISITYETNHDAAVNDGNLIPCTHDVVRALQRLTEMADSGEYDALSGTIETPIIDENGNTIGRVIGVWSS